MRILICDDDLIFVRKLQQLVASFFEHIHVKCPVIDIFTDGQSLLDDKEHKDILFLDIEMPGINGICVGNELAKREKNIIIFVITSYPQYLDDAMRFHVFRYLSKPLDEQRFFCNMRDALRHFNSIDIKIAIETRQVVYTLPASSIVAIEGQGQKVLVHTTCQTFESIRNMQYWSELLPANLFFQTHRSFIINFRHVMNFNNTCVHLAPDNLTAYLTRRKYKTFKESYLLYLEGAR